MHIPPAAHLKYFTRDDLHILAADFAPTRQAALSLLAIIEQQEFEIERLDAETACSVTTSDELRSRRASIQQAYDTNKALLAPIRKIPPEILGEIFLHCIPVLRRPYDSISLTLSEAPLLLMQVCRRWRRVAAGTPRLWIELDLGGEMDLKPSTAIHIWLTNSRTVPVNITTPHRLFDWTRDRVEELLAENFRRFRHFRGGVDKRLGDALWRRRPIHAPLLESFDIAWGADGTWPSSCLKGCIHAPKLATIVIQHPMTVNLLSFDPLSLRSITLDPQAHVTSLFSYTFLESCLGLSSLRIGLYPGMQPPAREGLSRIVLPSLDNLRIRLAHVNPWWVFDMIRAPALRALAIINEHAETIPIVGALGSFLGRDPPLQKLYLRDFYEMDLDGLAALLSRLRSLHSLRLRYCDVNDPVVEALILPPSSSPSSWICPRLLNLDFKGATFSWELFMKLVSSRAHVNEDLGTSHGVYLRYIDVRDIGEEHHYFHLDGLNGIIQRIDKPPEIKVDSHEESDEKLFEELDEEEEWEEEGVEDEYTRIRVTRGSHIAT